MESAIKDLKTQADAVATRYGLVYRCTFENTNGCSLFELSSGIKSFPVKYTTIDTSNEQSVNDFLYNFFDELQQAYCKLLAKAWIKIVEPRKQSKYPYNKGNSRAPPWWPKDCRHKEPDHLRKQERIALLVSLVRTFYEMEAKLVDAAQIIGEIECDDRSIHRLGPLSERKLALLRNVFTLLTSPHQTVEVIKPGRKFSAKFFQKKRSQEPSTPKDEMRFQESQPARVSKRLKQDPNSTGKALPSSPPVGFLTEIPETATASPLIRSPTPSPPSPTTTETAASCGSLADRYGLPFPVLPLLAGPILSERSRADHAALTMLSLSKQNSLAGRPGRLPKPPKDPFNSI